MSLLAIIITIVALGSIVSALLLIYQSAKKFNLSPAQLQKIKERNQQLEKDEKQQE